MNARISICEHRSVKSCQIGELQETPFWRKWTDMMLERYEQMELPVESRRLIEQGVDG